MLKNKTAEERLAALTGIYNIAATAPFYTKKYADIPAPVTWDDWAKIPFLSRDEVFNNAFPHSTDMLTCPVEGMIVIATGGSQGIARHTVFTHAEWHNFAAIQAAALSKLGVTSKDRVANLFVAGNMWPSFLGGHEIIKHIGAVHLPISAGAKAEDVIRYCVDFSATVMLSLPTALVFYADAALQNNIQIPSLRLALYAGEQMSTEAKNHFIKAFPNAQVKAVAYTSADAGLMGYQCPCCGFGEYHLPTAFQHLEILEPDSGKAMQPGEKGEIFVTNLARFSMPVIRYQIGDLASWVDQKCPCGDPNPLFRLAGRAGDDFKLGGAYISLAVVERLVSELGKGLLLNYCLILEDIVNQVDITLQLETSDPEGCVALEQPLRERLQEEISEFRVGLEMQYIRKLTIEFLPVGSLPANPRTGKTKHLVDKRVIG